MEHLLYRELLKRAPPLIWTEAVFLAIINIMAISGNISVCYAVYRNQRLRSLANMFVIALAVSDLLVSVCGYATFNCYSRSRQMDIRDYCLSTAGLCNFNVFDIISTYYGSHCS